MNIDVHRKGAVALALLVALMATLGGGSAALAAQSDVYDPFTDCPTRAPALNDPASELAVCAAGSVRQGTLGIGEVDIPIRSLDLQFAATGLGVGDPECPQPEFCFGRVPGTTTVESRPSVVEIPVGRPGHGYDRRWGKRVRLKLTVESAGDIRAVSPGFIFELPVPLFRLPVKLRVEGAGLGRHCYIGSEREPILLNPLAVGQPGSADFGLDPNGFAVETLTVVGLPLADQAFAVPRARGCGYFHSHRQDRSGPADRIVDELLDLPSPAGANELALPATDIAFAVAQYDGTPPDGGAELRAAFKAAR